MIGKPVSKRLTLLASLLFALAAIFSSTALSSGNEHGSGQHGGDGHGGGHGGGGLSLTPFSRVARIGPIHDPIEADALAKEVATAIATYVATVDDTVPPEEGGTGFPANWILGGLEGDPTEDAIEEAILRVPTPYVIDPYEPMSASNRKKVNIVEMCNPLFAKKALGVLPVVDDDPTTKIVNGYIHAPALPCEVAIYAEGRFVKVDMLNPEAIFTLFFTDVLFGEQMLDPDFAAAVQELPVVVNGEIQTIINLALETNEIDYRPQSRPLGPKYRSLEDIVEVVEETPFESPYAHFVYQKQDNTDFSAEEVGAVAAAIIDTLSLDGTHDPELDDLLNIDDWRSARPAPLPVPGNLVIEACSPTNAIAAMGLGMEHATALPCEIAIKALNKDGVDGNEILMITYLDPHFMFGALFNDAFDDLSKKELKELLELPTLVFEDLQTIVEYALYDTDLTDPEQVFYDMLPAEDDEEEDD